MAAEPAACVLSCPLASHLHCGKHFRKHAGKATRSGGGGCPITPGPIERLAGPGTRTLRKGTHRALGLMVPLARQTYGPDIRPTCRQGSHSSEKRSAQGRTGPERRCGPDLTPEPSWTRSCGSAQCGRTRQRGRSAQLRAAGTRRHALGGRLDGQRTQAPHPAGMDPPLTRTPDSAGRPGKARRPFPLHPRLPVHPDCGPAPSLRAALTWPLHRGRCTRRLQGEPRAHEPPAGPRRHTGPVRSSLARL